MNQIVKQFDYVIDRVPCLKECLQVTRIRDLRERDQQLRVVYINNVQPNGYNGERPLKYAGNSIKTSKYNLINFLPKNLFEQFRRIANFYFLINIIITLVTPDPPTSPYTSIIPLAIVVVVTAIKQGYEDVLRHLSDREINRTKVNRVAANGQIEEIQWSQVVCGDIVQVTADSAFPCDLVLLYADTEDHTCHITTANLDGESNLKIRRIPVGIPQVRSPVELGQVNGAIIFDKPNPKLYEFKGKLIMNGREFPLTNDNILLRGTRLKVAKNIFGCALYTGKDTKVMLNSKFKSNKMSCVERRLNLFIVIFLIILLIMTVISFGLSFMYKDIYKNTWYLDGREPSYYYSNTPLYNFIVFVFYMNLYNYIIPLSMYVTIELQRFIGSQFIGWDMKMYDEKLDEPAKANNSDINEDLGQIEYLFSDKTGTLTENEMLFKQCAIDGVIYEERQGRLINTVTNQAANLQDQKLAKFLEIMAVCHTVQIDNTAHDKFQASSPDEYSFLKFCEKIGIFYLGERKDPSSNKLLRYVNFLKEQRTYEVLHVLEFDSNRKRMSIIVRSLKSNEILLLVKGAEDSIYTCCTSGNVQQCDTDISSFAKLGWRTLAFGYRVLQQADFQNYDRLLLNAYNDINHREARMAQAFKEIESGLTLIGASGIEDRLQEDCADTLEALRRAGIKVWVLTGDKKETAMNISKSCKHFSAEMTVLNLTDLKVTREIEHRLDVTKQHLNNKTKNETFALVVDGKTLVEILDYFSDRFLEICLQCDAVLCCRMSPAQKATIVRLVKKSDAKPMTAAVGDGANDVSMIQEAHVGFGIYGKEGRNAARSADFAFGKFKYLKRITLVHGYYYYTRTAYLVNYFFYKNLAFVLCQFYYSYFNAFSIQSLFNSLILTFFNITFTSAPIFFFGLFEKREKKITLERNPYLYRFLTKNSLLTMFEFLKWNLFGTYHSLVSYFFAYGIFAVTNSFSRYGTTSGTSQFGAVTITIVFLCVHLKLLLETRNINVIYVFGYFLSFLSYVILLFLPNAFIMPSALTSFTDNQDMYWVYFDMFSHGQVWFCIAAAMVTALIPDTVVKIIENLLERYRVNEMKHIELDRQFSKQYPGYPINPTKEQILAHLKQRHSSSKNNQVSNWSYDNTNFINDNNEPKFIEGQQNNGTYVITDSNRIRYNNPFVYNWPRAQQRAPFNPYFQQQQQLHRATAPGPFYAQRFSQPIFQQQRPPLFQQPQQLFRRGNKNSTLV